MARTPHGPHSPLLTRVEQVCDDVLALGLGAAAAQVTAVRAALDEPIRVAVVGRVKAGKSTLVNALVGRKVAPTAASECTRVVTWYRYGAPDRAEVVLRDGTRRTLPFDGRLPDDLGVPVAQVDRVEVHLQAGALREVTIIDTPGLATTTAENEAATRRALLGAPAESAGAPERASTAAATQADAVLFLFRDAERGDEVSFLEDFAQASGELGASAVNALGLLAQADVFGEGPWGSDDPLTLAATRAATLATDRAGQVSDVLPVAALMAETARTGRLREADARTLHALADTPDVALRLFEQLGPPEGADPIALRRLLALLGPYALARGRGNEGLDRLLAWLQDAAGIVAVEELIRRRFLHRADLLKADHALVVLERTVAPMHGPQAAEVRALVEQARLDAELHPLREVRALQLLTRSAPTSPLVEVLTTLTERDDDRDRLGVPAGTPAADVVTLARARVGDAQAQATLAALPAEAEAARTAARSFLLIARRHQDAS